MHNILKTLILLLFAFPYIIHSDLPTLSIQLNKIYELQLGANTKFTFEIELPFKLSGKPNLYITAYSPINDPYQQPNLNIITNDYQLICNSQSTNLNSVCFIPNTIVSKQKKFIVQAICFVNCYAKVVAYLSETLQLDLNQQVKITTKNSPIQKMIQVLIPPDYDFTEIQLLTSIKNTIQVTEGVQMYINCGKQPLQYPSKNAHQDIKIVSWGQNKAAILRNGIQISKEDKIYILITVGTNTSLTFQSRVVSNSTRYLQLNQYFYDWLQSQQRLYILNLTDIDTRNLTSIYIQLTQFAGSPMIQVSFDKQFNNKKILQSATFNIRFEITPEMMQTNQFKNVIFVRISSFWSATYSLYSRFKYNDSDSIQVGISQYIEVKPNSIGVLIHDRNQIFYSKEQHKTLQIKIQNEGAIQSTTHIFACREISILNCKVNKNTNSLNTIPVGFQQLITSINKQTIITNYSMNNCLNTNPQKIQEYICIIVIIVIPKNNQQIGKYSVTVLEQQFIIPLSEGKSKLSKVQKQQYKFFSFYLPQKQSDLMQIFFFVNTLDGLTKIFVSTQLPKPKMDNIIDPRVKIGSDSISFKGQQIRQGMYYLTVYGYQFSDFIINVIVRRLDLTKYIPIIQQKGEDIYSKTQLSQIQLTQSIAQLFVIQLGKTLIKFNFKSLGVGRTYLKITQIVGKISTYYTSQINHNRILCKSNQCQIYSQQGQNYLVQVIGNATDIQRFTIVFIQNKQCYAYPLGTPIYISLDQNDIQCLYYTVNKSSSFQISNSLTNLQLLNQVVQIIVIYQNTMSFSLTTNTHLFQNTQLNSNCYSNPCIITIKYISFDEQVQFQTIAQKLDGVITLYDGVVQKIDIVLTPSNAIHYRYPIDIESSIEIYLSSQSSCSFIIYASLVQQSQSKLPNSYPNSFTSANQSWTVSSSIDSPIITMLPINKAKLKKIISEKKLVAPFLLISVFGKLTEKQLCTYSVEVTQKERLLREGDLQIGFLQPKEFVTYELYPSQMSLFSIRPLYKDKCYKIFDENNIELKDNILIQSPKTIPIYYRIQGHLIWNCMYQISLQNFKDTILTIVQGFPTKIVNQYYETTYLLYKHITNSSFKIYQFIQAGSSRIYATPLTAHQLQNGLKNIADYLSLSQFKYRDDLINNLYIQAKSNSVDYCFDCYYLIAIRGDPSVQEQIVVARDDTPITIREHTLFSSHMVKDQSDTFAYYSTLNANWSLNVDIVFGSVNVTIKQIRKGTQNPLMINQLITNGSRSIDIPSNSLNISKSIPIDLLDQQQKYRIEITGIKQTLYHIQIIKYLDSYKIAQGISSKIAIPVNGKINLQFDNNLDANVIYVNIQTNFVTIILIQTKVYYSKDVYTSSQGQLIKYQTSVAGRVATISFNGKKGHYVIKMSNFMPNPLDFVVSMPRPGLSELRVGHPTVSKTQGIYQLYTDDDSYAIIQVFPCQGNIKIRGAENPSVLSRGTLSTNQVQLLHQNVGGHFIITTPKNTSNNYFIRVQNKQYQANIRSQVSGIAYMIQYQPLQIQQINPYYELDVQNYQINIDYNTYNQYLVISLANVQSLNTSVKVVGIHYIFAIGLSNDDVKNYMFCANANTTKRLTYAFQANVNQSKFSTKISKRQIVKNGGYINDAYIGVTAGVVIQGLKGDGYANLTFLYQPAYLGKLKTTQLISDFGLFQLLVVISFVIGGIVVVFAIINYLIKVCRGYFPTNQLMQQTVVNNSNDKNVEVKSSQFEISNEKQQKRQPEQVHEVHEVQQVKE